MRWHFVAASLIMGQVKIEGIWYESVSQVQGYLEFSIPLPVRLISLRNAVIHSNRLVTIEQELLLLACAYRCLVRTRQEGSPQICLNQYKSLSRRLSDRKFEDSLGLFR